MVDDKQHGYYVEGVCFDARIAQARGRARHLSNIYGRNVEIRLVDATSDKLVCTYEPGGEVRNVTPGGRDGAKADV